MQKKSDRFLVQLINGSGVFANSYFRPIPMQKIELHLPGMAGKSVKALNGGTGVAQSAGDALIITLDQLNEYEAIEIF